VHVPAQSGSSFCQLMGFCGYSVSNDPKMELLEQLNTCQLLKVDPE
jgi:hypothetical protein